MATTIRLLPEARSELTAEVIEGLNLVGETVTFGNQLWWVHSVEGNTWYAFKSGNVISADLNMTPRTLAEPPTAMIIPVGHKIGEGFGREVPIMALTRGVSLAKVTD